MKTFPNYKQSDSKDCGATCLKIIAKHFGKIINIQKLRTISETTREGSNLLSLSDAAEKIGFRTLGVKLSLEKLQEAPLPCVLHWNNNHYVVLYKVRSRKIEVGSFLKKMFRMFSSNNPPTSSSKLLTSSSKLPTSYYISDPAIGLLEYNQEEFIKFWIGNNADKTTEDGIA